MSDWSRRALVTLALIAAAHVLQFVPLPWIDLYEWGSRGMLGDVFVVSRDSFSLSVAALGIVPLATGLGLTTLIYAIVPRLRRRLEQPDGESRVLRIGLYASVPFALVQSVGIGLFVQSVTREQPMGEQSPWLVGSLLFLFAMLYAALPLALTRWGLGRGLAAAALLYCLLQFAAVLHAIAFDALVQPLEPPFRNVALAGMLIAATVGAARRWLGDAALLPGEPRLDRIGRGLSLALIALAALQSLGLQRAVDLAQLGPLGQHVLALSIAVGGGFLLADRTAVSDPRRPRGAQLLALGTFLVFAASTTAVLADESVAMPWAEIVVATILLYASWRAAQVGPPPAEAPALPVPTDESVR